ncbi:hypothetical protein [Pseudooceanicola sp. 200-1SW]|uniref:hypothetical protein n=1 Tax=Pseudooceanicola sp. 200-1SW TaxID=3425949 RepID=UPI003D7F28A1
MDDISYICQEIGRKEMEARLGVSKAAIANAVAQGRFPARWYLVVREMCAEKDIVCPDGVFSFAKPTAEDAA